MYIDLNVVKWLKPLYNSAHVKNKRERKMYKTCLGILKEKLRL